MAQEEGNEERVLAYHMKAVDAGQRLRTWKTWKKIIQVSRGVLQKQSKHLFLSAIFAFSL